jgi:hypothetical protein
MCLPLKLLKNVYANLQQNVLVWGIMFTFVICKETGSCNSFSFKRKLEKLKIRLSLKPSEVSFLGKLPL